MKGEDIIFTFFRMNHCTLVEAEIHADISAEFGYNFAALFYFFC